MPSRTRVHRQSIVQLATGKWHRARRASRQLLALWLPSPGSSPQRARCTDAVWTIGSDVYAARPGQVAAHGGHAGLTVKSVQYTDKPSERFKHSCPNYSCNEPAVNMRCTQYSDQCTVAALLHTACTVNCVYVR